MKISNSKKQLAKIISENGGWPEGAKMAAQQKNVTSVEFWTTPGKLSRVRGEWIGRGHMGDRAKFLCDKMMPNHHQTTLSRDEYFHLYPAQVVEPEFCESVTRSIPEPEAKPTIEKLAADYSAKLAIAQRAQEEADSHRRGADAALDKLVAAGKALGLVLSVAEPETELVITDWRDLRVGDTVKVTGFIGNIIEPNRCDELLEADSCTVICVLDHGVKIEVTGKQTTSDGWSLVGAVDTMWRFIRRP